MGGENSVGGKAEQKDSLECAFFWGGFGLTSGAVHPSKKKKTGQNPIVPVD